MNEYPLISNLLGFYLNEDFVWDYANAENAIATFGASLSREMCVNVISELEKISSKNFDETELHHLLSYRTGLAYHYRKDCESASQWISHLMAMMKFRLSQFESNCPGARL